MHPGGPFWSRKDDGAWSIPKGEIDTGETAIEVARREFMEELGQPSPEGTLTSLGSVRQAGGKVVHAWASHGDVDVEHIGGSTFQTEWPPRSGRMHSFPEVDRAQWFDLATARRKLNAAQQAFIDRLASVGLEQQAGEADSHR